MSQLIQLKQRIKAISSIKKITQTMRLIAISSHSKLKIQAESIQKLKNEIQPILCALNNEESQYKSKNKDTKLKTLYILFAAEKGLCGTFNSTMFKFFNEQIINEKLKNSHVISVGKKTKSYLDRRKINPIKSFKKVLPGRIGIVAQEIYEEIIKLKGQYEEVVCLYSLSRGFFAQDAKLETIIPIKSDPCNINKTPNLENYEWLQNKKDVKKSLFYSLLKINILSILTNSMLSEQSSRFISMNNATQSADGLKKDMELSYNKMRQSKITRELIELIPTS